MYEIQYKPTAGILDRDKSSGGERQGASRMSAVAAVKSSLNRRPDVNAVGMNEIPHCQAQQLEYSLYGYTTRESKIQKYNHRI